jgi:hypothetical protein
VNTRDDEFLDILAAGLGPPPEAEPSWAEVSQLHRVVDTAAGRGWGGRRGAPVWRVRRPLTAAMAGFLVLGGASAAAAVSGAVMPQPVRVAARAVGLPVDSPQLAGARGALARLRGALAATPHDPAEIRARAQEVRDRVGRLSADDRSQVEDEASFLLAQADNALAPPPAPLGTPPPEKRPASPSTAAPASPSAEPADDHGRDLSADPNQSGHGSDDQPSGDDHSGSSAVPTGSGSSGPGSSGSSGDDHTATTQAIDNSGHGSSDGGSSHDGGGSGSDGGGHSGPG